MNILMISQKYIDDFVKSCIEHDNYELTDVLGKGSYGIVFRAIDKSDNSIVAIKRIYDCFTAPEDAIRILREVKFLRLMKHPNIIEMKRILRPTDPIYNDLYLVFEDMDCDLKRIIELNHGELKPEHMRYFLYQMLHGLKFLHSINIFHRDLKPANILLNENCTLKICDFGLAKMPIDKDIVCDTDMWTDYISTRWYRAPELCGAKTLPYTKSIDIWSLGCIFAEICNGKALFRGKNALHQLILILNMIGKPNKEAIENYYCAKAQKFIEYHKISAISHNLDESIDRTIEQDAVDILYTMLNMNPNERPTVDELLKHRYFESTNKQYGNIYEYKNNNNDPEVKHAVYQAEFAFEKIKFITLEKIRELMEEEIDKYPIIQTNPAVQKTQTVPIPIPIPIPITSDLL
jgi:serine/threonine protein kinase